MTSLSDALPLTALAWPQSSLGRCPYCYQPSTPLALALALASPQIAASVTGLYSITSPLPPPVSKPCPRNCPKDNQPPTLSAPALASPPNFNLSYRPPVLSAPSPHSLSMAPTQPWKMPLPLPASHTLGFCTSPTPTPNLSLSYTPIVVSPALCPPSASGLLGLSLIPFLFPSLISNQFIIWKN